MNELPLAGFLEAIEKTHGSRAEYAKRQRILVLFQGKVVWRGEVLVFALLNHPTAKTCYAWSVDGRVTAVLHEGAVDSPGAAVRAAIAAEQHCQHCGARLIQGDRACPKCGRSVHS